MTLHKKIMVEPVSEYTKKNPFSALDTNSLYKTVFSAANDGIIFLNAKGKVIEANPAAYSILGINKNEPQLIYVEAFFSFHTIYNLQSQEIPKHNWPIERLLRNEKFTDEKLAVVPAEDQVPAYLSFTGIPQTDEQSNFTSGILIIRDISPEVELSGKPENTGLQPTKIPDPLKHYRKHRKKEQQLLETLINSIPVMITVYNETIDTITLNKATTKFTGWTNEDAAKTNIMELAYPDPDYRQKIIDFMQSLQPGYVDIIMRTKDGRDIETSWANVKIHDGLQVGVGFDISDRKRMENELISARKKAEKENQVQHAFLQNISHEVRTPMNSILGFTELLQQRLKGEKDTEFVNAISYNGKQLLRLIDDIVDFSRLDKKELTLQKEEVSIQHLVEQTRMQFGGMKTSLRKKHLKLNVKSEYKLNKIVIYTDLYRLQQIISNLLSNAVKYSDTGTIELGINIRKKEKDLLFYVKDPGIGIKKEDHHRVFNRFNRFHDTTKAEFRGTGLGLAISKYLVELLGGKIWFESKAGKGSVFYFTHPFEDFQLRVESEKKPKHEKNYSLPDLSGTTILIAEDDRFSFMLMNQMLMETKANILHAETGKEALDLFRQNKVDLVFLDIRLPEMDGYEVIKEMRKETKTTPIIAQTAHVLPDDRKKIKRNGFNYHASKPLSQNELFSILNRYIKKN